MSTRFDKSWPTPAARHVVVCQWLRRIAQAIAYRRHGPDGPFLEQQTHITIFLLLQSMISFLIMLMYRVYA